MWFLAKPTFESIVIASKKNHPNEFMAFLASKKKNKVIDEIVVVPTFSDSLSASIRTDLLPFDKTIVGTVHSHPSGTSQPSKADLKTFNRTGKIHFIISAPYTLKQLKAFNFKGGKILWKLK